MPKPEKRRKPITATVVTAREHAVNGRECGTLSAVAAEVFSQLHYGVEPGDTVEIRLCGRIFKMV